MTIGERIKEKRKELKLSQRELAAKMGYSHHSTLARIEAGKVDVSQTRIVQFAKVLGVSVAYLMGWEKATEEAQKKNDVAVDIVIRLGEDEEFKELVKLLYTLDSQQIASIRQMLSGFIK